MEIIALLRGVMPTGKNRIPKMTFLVEILEKAGLKNVKTLEMKSLSLVLNVCICIFRKVQVQKD
ncbi:hypothetical protein HMPREF9943_00728 [Eggerthia catenaformis OT 569 = DSM 20559]|uniref:DUF1697 domain-containing protein n=1 Tax=Eggerthia catenaformis OT 569 = DSM 20559 TaxID=999415 RepID=M2Q222_9FIRM|nr:DUF1697 domain-containing protein [Eggerthia catenaformis]EMD16950.1 hypothetical protein HMPREF9943_00728 [Eggerthia catenaformis OT 569 = DSM 20559]